MCCTNFVQDATKKREKKINFACFFKKFGIKFNFNRLFF